jgi:hypothetical protein
VIAFFWRLITVPGKRITDLQVTKYRTLRGEPRPGDHTSKLWLQ